MRTWMQRWFTVTALVTSIVIATVAGCGKNDAHPDAKAASNTATTNSPRPIRVTTVAPGAAPAINGAPAFKDAVLFEPPENEQRPPDMTATGLNVASLFERIAGTEGTPGLWDKIALRTPDGKLIRYTAQLKTDLGTIDIELFSEAAPNHVRNFIALAQTGYYNGLPFHRSINKQVDGDTVAYLEGGCPLGTGDFDLGSIGYWLKPEISARLTHEEGTVGAVHGEAMESAACKFYITLAKAPGMDGNNTIFGKITRGLDVAQAINKRPNADGADGSDRPKEPIVIRDVTIQASVDPAVVARRSP